jgi:5'(3')-deoxyribonucleotidase
MNKPVIAVDIDEVLFPNVKVLLPYFNKVSGTDVKAEQMKSYFIEDLTGESTESVLKKIEAHVKGSDYDDTETVEKAIESIKLLRQNYDLIVVTSRQVFWRGYTEKFLQKHFAGVFKDLHYTHTLEAPDSSRPKFEICKEIGAKYLIDDHLSNVTTCAENGIKAILFGDYPWNQTNKLPEGVTRCKDWPAVLEYFEGIK